MKYRGLVISDIHVGAFDVARQMEEIKEIFIEYIYSLDKLDFLVITGDFFDYKFFLNDKESVYAYSIMQLIINACKYHKAKLRIVYGTESHENNQYDILSMLNLYDDIKVIKNVSEEELLPDLNVLYLPEEYVESKEEYYKEYFSNVSKYDYIFGHGIIREVSKDIASHIKATERKRKFVPVFNSAELGKICRGQIFFGHYHIRKIIDGKFFSVGSFSRWEYGQDESKGFYEISHDTDTSIYECKFIENTLAHTYKTIPYGYKSEIWSNTDSMVESLNHIDKLINDKVMDHVRFEFSIPSTVENPEGIINYIRERYKFNKNVKIDISHGYIEDKKEREKEILKKENEKYAFIDDDNLSTEDEVRMFISVEYNEELPLDRIDAYMNKDINEILEIVNEEEG